VGWERREFKVMGHVSRHNSHRDRVDDVLWDEVVKRFQRVLADLNRSGEFDSLDLRSDGLEDE
jgi:hypothetical protein